MNNWSGKVWASFGDSVTAQEKWQPSVSSTLTLTHTSYGVGGRRVSGASGMCQDAAVDAIPTTIDVLTVMGGINDWSASVAIGTASSSDTANFYGALNQMASKLVTRFPLVRIFWMTPNYAELGAADIFSKGWSDGITNLNGNTLFDYAEAICVVARKWGFPIIDLIAEGGLNTTNIDAFTEDDGGFIHPDNDEDNGADRWSDHGGKRVAEVVIGRLKQFNPVP